MGRMSAAADALNLTQPALSKQIALLEETLGLRLFARRRGGPVEPTREGIALYKSIEGTLYGLDAIPDIARDIAQKVRIQLRVAATPLLINCKPFMVALAAFRARMPEVQISLFSRQRVDLEDWVRNRQADVCLGLLPSRYPDLVSRTLAEVHGVAVMSPGHPLAGQNRIRVADLEKTTLVLPSRQPLRDRIDAAFPRLSCDIETSSSITCVGLALSQNAIALCDPFSPTMYPPDLVRTVLFEPELPLSYGAILTRDAESDPLIAALLQELKTSFTASTNIVPSP
jgi:DNA-binding transcriptional LysR family regulator